MNRRSQGLKRFHKNLLVVFGGEIALHIVFWFHKKNLPGIVGFSIVEVCCVLPVVIFGVVDLGVVVVGSVQRS